MRRVKPGRIQWRAAVLAILTVLFCAGGVSAQQAADQQTWLVVGAAPIQSGNLLAAREAAIANGMMEAVALTAAEVLSPEKFSTNFKTVSDQLLENPDRFIQNFKVLSEAPVGKQHRVALQVTVARNKILAAADAAGLSESRSALPPAPVEMTVEGTANLPNFVAFRRYLGAIPGVEAVQIIEMRLNETVLLVKYAGSAGQLSAALMQQGFETFTLDVSEAGENALRVKLLPK
jgi:hypothetical protein